MRCKLCKTEETNNFQLYCSACKKKINDSLKILHGHNDENTAIIKDNYPYGRLRTKIKYWIETTKHGDRFVSQTLNPKTLKWNKPKKSTYADVMVMTEDFRGYIDRLSYGVAYTDEYDYNLFISRIGAVPLNQSQQEKLRLARAILKTRRHVKCKVVNTNDETPEQREKREAEQQAIKRKLKKAVCINYAQDNATNRDL